MDSQQPSVPDNSDHSAASTPETTSDERKTSPDKSAGKTKGKAGKSKSAPKLTPMMERFFEVKRQHPDSLLLFRMGDFYELFYDDAVIAAKILGLTLTSRDKGSANPISMAGFPYHSLDNYLQKLIRNGHRAAICDQVEDPKQAKGLVKREVTRIVTPGTLTEDALLDPRQNNYLAAVCLYKKTAGLAWLELSTGRFQLAEVDPDNLSDELSRLHPAELLINQEQRDDERLASASLALPHMLMTERPPWSFAGEQPYEQLCKHFRVRSLEGFDIEGPSTAVTAAGVLLEYVQETQRTAIDHIRRIEPYSPEERLLIDEATRRSLELTHTLREGKRQGTLLDVIDETVTAMGARLIGEWISNPLTNRQHITRRADAVEELVGNPLLLNEFREQLDNTYDLQRLATRVATGRCSPRDLTWLAKTLSLLPATKKSLSQCQAARLHELHQLLDECEDVCADISSCLVEDPPINVADGDLVRAGYNDRLDELRDLSRGGKEWIARYQAEEIERTGIQNLKVGFNKVFGYYLEVTAAQAQKVPEDYIRKQTLKNQERFITPQLKEHEEKVLSADQQSLALETEIFQQLRERVADQLQRLQQSAETLAELDVLGSFAHTAANNDFCRPVLTESPVLRVVDGRHPVLDHILPRGQFVPNDIHLGQPEKAEADEESTLPDAGRVQIITGPNMAGKSTYIRQAALVTLLAQAGSFVPAREATVGLVDRIFARVGASDELSKGQSTFMVEMTETARILNTATNRSLVILDEIGRGTSTYDGLSLAWAVTEYLHDTIGARTLFATHYHELTELEQTLSAVRNWNVSVYEKDGDVIFLHKIVPGAADRSYGIHVARLAGVPTDVLRRAGEILSTLESDHVDETGKPTIPPRQTSPQRQLTLFEAPPHPVIEKLKKLDLDALTPKAALDRLYELRGELQS
ncbi:DNA mismatch repair protein MutS [Rubinisphaera brasiliensis]|uniref:DNA mismatch repair protein MutS n=1 Tax=Rubinisphaera brasiliensis (strain ATCC 49424 / DSM 5305 / JCM 21570 / IAM 15109 / NBRC 103401 / IFAM 1448) TaxID=756272 RepID=F0SP27_RUBBR|nr:DNA mismatch repair protein MutS [Rubinisphaera brasiliensis]ADY61130.1 DNA mismatch repair protein MutS [Rubinisphaera brasiliensis DSM 5305]